MTDFFSTGIACGACDKYRVCVFGQVTSLQDGSLMVFSIKGWEVCIFCGNVLVIPFRKYMTSYGLSTLCNGPETLTKWKVSVTKSISQYSHWHQGPWSRVVSRDAYVRIHAMRTTHLKIRMATVVIMMMCLTPPFSSRTSRSRGPKGLQTSSLK